ncbi:MAG: bifunctional phosphopantothenoylcysteine decarboxylase/phosphopantothenate synthase, partial [Planctomycetes bacterium]|nr:bifunctional phosphopantothenoylcysteine decarboxylase/phosphopantothenate synthase [Planctomycetota bacterium]
APAMNSRMWANPIVQANVATLTKLGFRMVGPATGRLACGTEGAGRMAEPSEIIAAIEALTDNKQ